MAGLYIHIPFCKQACYYCDFHFTTNRSYRDTMIDVLIAEIALQRDYLNRDPIHTIYFGGGTPSILSAESILRLLDTVRAHHRVEPSAEITLEANPDDLSRSKLSELHDVGINRLSIGVQTFDNQLLKNLNRAHDRTAALRCLEDVKRAGFDNYSVDLIYAMPDQSLAQLKNDVDTLLSFAPPHISAYTLTIEEKTVFGRWASQGRLTPVSDDFAAGAMRQLISSLMAVGYQHYEISNFSLPGFASRHNSHYWKGMPYLGIGPSAHSYNGVTRQYNTANNHSYMTTVRRGAIPATVEVLSQQDRINEYLLTRLRTDWGADLEELHRDFDFDLRTTRASYLRQLVEQQLATLDNNVLRLTTSGRLVADKITADLFIVPS